MQDVEASLLEIQNLRIQDAQSKTKAAILLKNEQEERELIEQQKMEKKSLEDEARRLEMTKLNHARVQLQKKIEQEARENQEAIELKRLEDIKKREEKIFEPVPAASTILIQTSIIQSKEHEGSQEALTESSEFFSILQKIKLECKPNVKQNPETVKKLLEMRMNITRRMGQLTISKKKLVEIAKVSFM